MTDTLNLLLVEDDELDRIAVRRALRKTELGFTLDEVDSVRAAADALVARRYDCAILDYQLPDGDAMKLLRVDRSAGPPAIILTGLGSESVAVELMKAGASDYLPKDELTPSRIAQSLRNAIRVWQSEAALRLAYEELEQRVVERTAELEAANAELEQQIADRLRAEERARKLQQQLAHVARLSTLGEMAGGLAHELNQPLGAISNFAAGCVERLRAGTADSEMLIGILGKIAAQAQRAGQIIHSLRALAAGSEPEKVVTSIDSLLTEVVDLVRDEALHREVALDLQLGAGEPQVEVDPIQIQQVILNLLRNGMEAMDEVEIGRRRLGVRTGTAAEGGVEVAVSDCGAGCPPEDLDRLFDAFFTTKKSGMGLGLAISRSIVEAHGGRLWAVANPDQGLTICFTILTCEPQP